MIKRFLIALVALAVVAGGLAGVKALQINRMIALGKSAVVPPEVVTTAVAAEASWESLLTAVGSLEAVQGVTVSAELSGKVVRIAFEPGGMVAAGDLLVQQDVSEETARLRAAEAAETLARINLERARQLVAVKSVSRSDLDNADASFKQAVAQADNIRAVIAKKTVRAPFSGRLGIRQVNLGQVLKESDPIVTLQSLDPVFVNFLLPQQQLSQLREGLAVRLTVDGFPEQGIAGKITAISPQINAATRNVKIQATVANPKGALRPGMYVDVAVVLPARSEVLSIPATAVLYAPYGDSVFVVEASAGQGSRSGDGLHLRQQFIRLGQKRGDFVAVSSGLKAGETVVSTGVFKLRNGQAVVVDNTLAPKFQQAPKPADA
jgi:membrane fusion protein (multidrug efflux system)